jgi:hypothetical protein
MTLPFPPRRSHLTAFWLGLHVAAFAVAGLLALGLGAPRAALAVALLLTGTLALGLGRRDSVLPAYRAWNKAAGVIARIGQGWILAVTYYLALTAIGRTGSRLDLASSPGSMWRPYGAGHASGNGTAEPRAGWARRLAHEARSRDRAWWIGVLPLLMILSLFASDSGDEDIPSNIYTLY